jgi:hypothetical protein
MIEARRADRARGALSSASSRRGVPIARAAGVPLLSP